MVRPLHADGRWHDPCMHALVYWAGAPGPERPVFVCQAKGRVGSQARAVNRTKCIRAYALMYKALRI